MKHNRLVKINGEIVRLPSKRFHQKKPFKYNSGKKYLKPRIKKVPLSSVLYQKEQSLKGGLLKRGWGWLRSWF